MKCQKERSKTDQVPSKILRHVSSMTERNVSFWLREQHNLLTRKSVSDEVFTPDKCDRHIVVGGMEVRRWHWPGAIE